MTCNTPSDVDHSLLEHTGLVTDRKSLVQAFWGPGAPQAKVNGMVFLRGRWTLRMKVPRLLVNYLRDVE